MQRSLTDHIIIDSDTWNEHGPDLAFLRLPEMIMLNIERTASVVDGDSQYAKIRGPIPESTIVVNIVCGIIDERTRPQILEESIVTTPFEALLNVGHIVDVGEANGMDLFCLQPAPGDGVVPPTSYEGTSGGGLWQIYLTKNDHSFVQSRLCGVAFWQKRMENEVHIVGHGQRSIYDTLLKQLRAKWP